MADERPLDQLSSADLFRGATAPPEPEAPVTPTQQAPEQVAPSEGSAPAVTADAPPPPALPAGETPEHIPSWRLREESEARRLAEDRARQLEEGLQQVVTHLQQQQKQPDFFDNPDQATQALILRALQPYAEATNRQLMAMGKMVASAMHGADKVDAAEEAFLKARDQQILDTADYERVVQAPNRYDAVDRWHAYTWV